MKLKVLLLLCTLQAVIQATISLPSYSNEENEIDYVNYDSAEDNNDDDSIDLSMYGERIYGHPDDKTGELVSTFDENVGNPEELGSYLEGDMLIPSDDATERNGVLGKSYRWPGAVVPYEIRGTFTTRDLSVIEYALKQYHGRTCVRFQPRTTEKDYISITNENTGCWSSVGRIGGRQQVNLQSPNCLLTYGTTIHELMHALGFFHEQNRWERDSYIKVLSENVKPGMMGNFAKSSSKKVYGFGVPYDYASVMHYSSKTFSSNGKPTIVALLNTRESRLMGQRNGFSAGDIAKINAMYRCKVRKQ